MSFPGIQDNLLTDLFINLRADELTLSIKTYRNPCRGVNPPKIIDQVNLGSDMWRSRSHITYIQARTCRPTDLTCQYHALTRRCSQDHGRLKPGTPDPQPHDFTFEPLLAWITESFKFKLLRYQLQR